MSKPEAMSAESELVTKHNQLAEIDVELPVLILTDEDWQFGQQVVDECGLDIEGLRYRAAAQHSRERQHKDGLRDKRAAEQERDELKERIIAEGMHYHRAPRETEYKWHNTRAAKAEAALAAANQRADEAFNACATICDLIDKTLACISGISYGECLEEVKRRLGK